MTLLALLIFLITLSTILAWHIWRLRKAYRDRIVVLNASVAAERTRGDYQEKRANAQEKLANELSAAIDRNYYTWTEMNQQNELLEQRNQSLEWQQSKCKDVVAASMLFVPRRLGTEKLSVKHTMEAP